MWSVVCCTYRETYGFTSQQSPCLYPLTSKQTNNFTHLHWAKPIWNGITGGSSWQSLQATSPHWKMHWVREIAPADPGKFWFCFLQTYFCLSYNSDNTVQSILMRCFTSDRWASRLPQATCKTQQILCRFLWECCSSQKPIAFAYCAMSLQGRSTRCGAQQARSARCPTFPYLVLPPLFLCLSVSLSLSVSISHAHT